MSNGNHLLHIPAWRSGAEGGFAFALVQIIGQGEKFADAFMSDDRVGLMEIVVMAILVLIGYPIIGALVARFSHETSRRNLFWLGVGAPAILAALAPIAITVITSGGKSILGHHGELLSVSTAYAGSDDTQCDQKSSFSLLQGAKTFFGVGDERRYHVVVGSFKNPNDAAKLVAKVNAEDPTLHAFVGNPAPCNPYYGVIVSPFLPAAEAKRLQDRVLQLDSVDGAYLSPYPYR